MQWCLSMHAPARSTRCSLDVLIDVTPSSIVCDSTTHVKTQCEREESALVRVPPVWRLAVPCLSSRTTSSPAQRPAACMSNMSDDQAEAVNGCIVLNGICVAHCCVGMEAGLGLVS